MSPPDEDGDSLVVVSTQTITIVGRTRVDAAVTVQDSFVDVDEEGTFELEIVLEEGPNLVEVVSSTGTGDELAAILIVSYEPPTP